jgi:hypothetical protein
VTSAVAYIEERVENYEDFYYEMIDFLLEH